MRDHKVGFDTKQHRDTQVSAPTSEIQTLKVMNLLPLMDVNYALLMDVWKEMKMAHL